MMTMMKIDYNIIQIVHIKSTTNDTYIYYIYTYIYIYMNI